MGLYNILFGGSSKPRVTEKEFKKVRGDLKYKGLNRRERDRVEEIFSGDMYEAHTSTQPKGIDKAEIEARIKWMKENKSKHHLSDKEIQDISDSMYKRL